MPSIEGRAVAGGKYQPLVNTREYQTASSITRGKTNGTVDRENEKDYGVV